MITAGGRVPKQRMMLLCARHASIPLNCPKLCEYCSFFAFASVLKMYTVVFVLDHGSVLT